MEFLAFLFFAIERGGVRSLVTCEPEAMTLEKIKLLGVALHDEGEKAIANLGLGQHISFEMCADHESHFEEFHFLRISPEQVRQFAVAINGLDGFDDLGDLSDVPVWDLLEDLSGVSLEQVEQVKQILTEYL